MTWFAFAGRSFVKYFNESCEIRDRGLGACEGGLFSMAKTTNQCSTPVKTSYRWVLRKLEIVISKNALVHRHVPLMPYMAIVFEVEGQLVNQ